MLRSVNELLGYTIRATDGDIGNVHDFYFDDQSWVIRYLVVETDNWLAGRSVLISPVALGLPEWQQQVLPVQLTQKQVKNSPSIDLDKPVSRQMEEKLHVYYGWLPYWKTGKPYLVEPREPGPLPLGTAELETSDNLIEHDDPHLRSVEEVTGYQVQARDGDIGQLEQLIADDEAWIVRYLVADTGEWLANKRVLLSPKWIESLDWVEREVIVDLSQHMVENSPEFDPSAPVNREYEARLYDYYGRPRYWTEV